MIDNNKEIDESALNKQLIKNNLELDGDLIKDKDEKDKT